MEVIAQNLKEVRRRIDTAAKACGRNPAEVELIAVSKTKPAELIRKAFEAGQCCFGENYAQELRAKAGALHDLGLQWHFIGHVQRNKAKLIAPIVKSCTIDSLATAESFNKRVERSIDLFIEVNIGGEKSKSGVEPQDVPSLLRSLEKLRRLHIIGLMCIPPYDTDAEKSRPYFQHMRKLADTLRLPHLSMGMSHDFEVAIQEGATIIRVGSAIFGERD